MIFDYPTLSAIAEFVNTGTRRQSDSPARAHPSPTPSGTRPSPLVVTCLPTTQRSDNIVDRESANGVPNGTSVLDGGGFDRSGGS